MSDEDERARDHALDYDLDLVPLTEREKTVERVIRVRQDVPRCAAYTRRGEQCPHRGVSTFIHRRAVPLCAQHRAVIGQA